MTVIMIMVLWLTNGDVGVRWMFIPSNEICELNIARYEAEFERAEDVRAAVALCAHPTEPI